MRAEILRRLATECKESEYRRLLLVDCVETYLPMEGEQKLAYQQMLDQDPRYQEVKAMLLSAHDRIRAEAKQEALREMVERMGSRRWGKASEQTLAALRKIKDYQRLERLVEATVEVASWEDLLAKE